MLLLGSVTPPPSPFFFKIFLLVEHENDITSVNNFLLTFDTGVSSWNNK